MFSLRNFQNQSKSEFSTIRENIILFGTLFSSLQYFSEQDDIVKNIPLLYGQKQLWITNLQNNFTSSNKIQHGIDLPRAVYYCNAPEYTQSKQLQRISYICPTDGSERSLNTLPVSLPFEFIIASTKSKEIMSMVENIMTKFSPDVNLRADRGIYVEELKLMLDNLSWDNSTEIGKIKIHIATFQFSMLCNFHNIPESVSKIRNVVLKLQNQELMVEVLENGCTIDFDDNLRIQRAFFGTNSEFNLI